MSYDSILVIKPSSLGDIVHTLPAVAAIHDAYPTAKITWVMNPEFTPLLRGNPDVDHIHGFPRRDFSGLGAPVKFGPWFKETRKLKPDLALDFQGLLRSAFIARASGAKQVYGMSDGREGSRFFYSKTAKVNKREHAVERYLKLAELAGARIGEALRTLHLGGLVGVELSPVQPARALEQYLEREQAIAQDVHLGGQLLTRPRPDGIYEAEGNIDLKAFLWMRFGLEASQTSKARILSSGRKAS